MAFGMQAVKKKTNTKHYSTHVLAQSSILQNTNFGCFPKLAFGWRQVASHYQNTLPLHRSWENIILQNSSFLLAWMAVESSKDA